MTKSSTDIHWNERALTEENHELVNIADISQRELETNFLLSCLNNEDKVLEVGCGNGFLTNILRDHVSQVDSFDYSENMIKQAKEKYGESNNTFFHDNVLSPQQWANDYDAIVCVRVLINLRDIEEQKRAIDYMHAALKPGGRLLLIEGYIDGFEELNRLRKKVQMPALSPASINFYSRVGDIKLYLENKFEFKKEFHTGNFDYLTRIVYPKLVGSENATGHSDFHNIILPIALNYNPDQFKHLARLQGFELKKLSTAK